MLTQTPNRQSVSLYQLSITPPLNQYMYVWAFALMVRGGWCSCRYCCSRYGCDVVVLTLSTVLGLNVRRCCGVLPCFWWGVCDVYRRCWSGDWVVGWLVVHTYSGFVVLLFRGHVLYCGGIWVRYWAVVSTPWALALLVGGMCLVVRQGQWEL